MSILWPLSQGYRHHDNVKPFFVVFETGSCYIAQASVQPRIFLSPPLKLLGLWEPIVQTLAHMGF